MNWNKSKESLDAWKNDTTFIASKNNRKTTYNIIADKNLPEKRQIVDIKLVSLRWMFQDGKDFCDLVNAFIQLDRKSWFCHDLMIALFKTNWQHARQYIMSRGFVPFVFYFLAALIYTDMIADSKIGEI